MELFGIMFSVPAAFVTSAAYAILVRRFVVDRMPLNKSVFWISTVIVGIWAVEFAAVVLLLVIGQDDDIRLIPYPLHSTLFFLVVPALANIFQFQKLVPFVNKWYFTALLCTPVALMAVLLQYTVSEAIFGID